MLLRVDRVGVRFGATVALDDVSFEVRPGEVHALIGENGAGKSTVLRLITGMVAAERGRIEIAQGTEVAWAPQEPLLPPDLTAGEWIFLGRERRGRLGLLRQREMLDEAELALREVGARIGAGARLGELPATQRKQVQLARALHGAPRLVLLDEPTAALGGQEAEALFAILRRRRLEGTAVLYVTHRLDEVRQLADRVTVLRDGRWISTDAVAEVDTATLVRRMVGRDLPRREPTAAALGEVVLRLDEVAVDHVRGACLEVHRGEIVGLAGLVGAGRSEILEAIAGVRQTRAGRIECGSPPVFVPEDRGGKGLIPTFGLRENVFLPSPTWWITPRREREETERWIDELSIRSRGAEAPIDSLSGGNQQKLLLARALRRRPGLLLLDEPTAGVDVGAKADLHDLVRRLAGGGAGILLASSDLPELLSLCDRVVVLRSGEVVGEVAPGDTAEARLGSLITGAADLRDEGR